MFVEKTIAEQEAMTNEELAKYASDFAAHKTAKIEAKQKELETLLIGKATPADIDAVKKEMTEILKEQGIAIKNIKNSTPIAEKSMLEQIKDSLVENLDALKSIKLGEKQKGDVQFAFKDINAMTFANVISGEIPQAQRLAGVNRIARRLPFLLSIINVGTASSPVISWVFEVQGDGGADYTTEGSKKNYKNAKYDVGTAAVKKFTLMIKISEEMLDDVDFMATEVNYQITYDLALKIDSEILDGGGTAELEGIVLNSTALTIAAPFLADTTEPNEEDVIEVAIAQAAVANKILGYVLINPVTIGKMRTRKTSQGVPLFPELKSDGTIAGLKVMVNNLIPAGDFCALDPNVVTAYFKKTISVDKGLDGNDFSQNFISFRAEARLALVIKDNDKTAIIYGTFANAINSMNKPSV